MKKFIKVFATLVLMVSVIAMTNFVSLCGNVISLSTSSGSGSISVSGSVETGVLAVSIFVYDSTGATLIAADNVAVSASNTFSGSFTVSDGTYIVKAADYNGGTFATSSVTVGTPTQSDSSNNLPNRAPKTSDNMPLLPVAAVLLIGVSAVVYGRVKNGQNR